MLGAFEPCLPCLGFLSIVPQGGHIQYTFLQSRRLKPDRTDSETVYSFVCICLFYRINIPLLGEKTPLERPVGHL